MVSDITITPPYLLLRSTDIHRFPHRFRVLFHTFTPGMCPLPRTGLGFCDEESAPKDSVGRLLWGLKHWVFIILIEVYCLMMGYKGFDQADSTNPGAKTLAWAVWAPKIERKLSRELQLNALENPSFSLKCSDVRGSLPSRLDNSRFDYPATQMLIVSMTGH